MARARVEMDTDFRVIARGGGCWGMNSECRSPDLSSELEVHTSDFLVDSAQSQANTSSVRGPKLEVASVPWTQGLALFPVYFPVSLYFSQPHSPGLECGTHPTPSWPCQSSHHPLLGFTASAFLGPTLPPVCLPTCGPSAAARHRVHSWNWGCPFPALSVSGPGKLLGVRVRNFSLCSCVASSPGTPAFPGVGLLLEGQ